MIDADFKRRRLTWTLAEKLATKEARERTPETQRDLEQACSKREEAVLDKDIVEALLAYGLDASGIEQESDGAFHLPVRAHFSERRLPNVPGQTPEFAYKGGAARALLFRSLRIDPAYVPRDVDIVAFGAESRPGLHDEISRTFMSEDFEHGHGADWFPSWSAARETYFSSRDFTLNEVLATDDDIWVTKQGLLDSVRRVIRVTAFERESYGGVGSKMLAKMLRIYAEGIERWGDMEIEDQDWAFEEAFIKPFWIALQLDKACEQSTLIGQAYVDELVRRKQLPETARTIEDAVDVLSQQVYAFAFRHAPSSQFELEDAWYAQSLQAKSRGMKRGDR